MTDARETGRGCCSKFVQRECTCRVLLFGGEEPEVFVTSQWSCCSQSVFLAYRLVVLFLILGCVLLDLIWIYSTYHHKEPSLWFLYATNWSVLLILCSSLSQAVNAIIDHTPAKHGFVNEMPLRWRHKLQWLLQEVSTACAIMVSVGFWGFIFLTTKDATMHGTPSKVKHIANSVYVLLDLWVCAVPVRLLHGIYAMALGFLYSAFEAMMFDGFGVTVLGGHHYVYKVQDWYSQPDTAALTAFLMTLLLLTSHCVIWGVAGLRGSVAQCCGGKRKEGDSERERLRLAEAGDNYMALRQRFETLEESYI